MGKERRARRLVKAVDTNVIARALMRDDPVQTPIADAILQTGAFVSITVLLELSWLLRSRYELDRRQLVRHLLAVIDMPQVALDDEDGLRWAIAQLAQTGDFADLIHIVASRRSTAFATFDKGIAKSAGPNPPLPIETLA